MAIVSFYLEFQRRHARFVPRPPETGEQAGAGGTGVEPPLGFALTLLALGWTLRYVADRFGGGWALAGHALALAGILVLARAMMAWVSPGRGGG